MTGVSVVLPFKNEIKHIGEVVRSADSAKLADFTPDFADDRLPDLLLHYKARNYPQSMSESEQVAWSEWRAGRIDRQLAPFMSSFEKATRERTGDNEQFILSELRLWVESLLPEAD